MPTAEQLKEWIKKDFIYIVVILFALLACMFTLQQSTEIMQECNDNWAEQLEGCTLLCDAGQTEAGFINGLEDNYNYTQRYG